jgi:hypothetical protein
LQGRIPLATGLNRRFLLFFRVEQGNPIVVLEQVQERPGTEINYSLLLRGRQGSGAETIRVSGRNADRRTGGNFQWRRLGFGRAAAQALAAVGVNEAVAAAETARETSWFATTADVTDAGSVDAEVTAARERYGPARIAVNCAGIGTAARIVGRDGPILGRPEEYAALVLHLCRNAMINGEVVRLDGGLRMAPR